MLSYAHIKRRRPNRRHSTASYRTDDIVLEPGYKIEPVISGLTFPTAVAFHDGNNLYFIESVYSYGGLFSEPKLFRVDGDKATLIAKGTNNGPWTGIIRFNGAFYVAEGGEMDGGKILKITKNGTITALISNLPTMGDHHTNGPVIKDGFIYFGLGVATNSGVVGQDNTAFGWLLQPRIFLCKIFIIRWWNPSAKSFN